MNRIIEQNLSCSYIRVVNINVDYEMAFVLCLIKIKYSKKDFWKLALFSSSGCRGGWNQNLHFAIAR